MREMLDRYSFFTGTAFLGLKLADPHIHTIGSDGLPTFEQVVRRALDLKLSAIAITDHDTIEPAQMAWRYAQEQDLDLEVVVGSEISSKDGHIIGLNLKEDIISGESAEETIRKILGQNGLVIIPHPMYGLTRSLGQSKLEHLFRNPEIVIHGFEVYNGAIAHNRYSKSNQKAQNFFIKNPTFLGTQMGGSDTHHLNSIGEAVTGYTGNNFCSSIKTGQTCVLYANELSVINFPDFIRQSKRGLVTTTRKRLERYLKRSFPLVFSQLQ